MTEQQWLTCTDPTPMLSFLRTSGKRSERKLRLFAVACCRRIWPLLMDHRSRMAVEVAEQAADRWDCLDELTAACDTAASAWGAAAYAADAAASAGGNDAITTAMLAADAAAYATVEQTEEDRHTEEIQQRELLRCIFGNPFRPQFTLDTSLLTPEILALAQTMYDTREFGRMASSPLSSKPQAAPTRRFSRISGEKGRMQRGAGLLTSC